VNTPRRSPVRIHLLVLPAFVFTFLLPDPAAAQTVSGRVLDPSGRPLPRAYVQLVAGADENNGVFTETDGRFRLETSRMDCHLQVTLTGFTSAMVPCEARPADVTLALAPVREAVVVSATRSEVPAAQLGASVTAFDGADLEKRQLPLVGDLLAASPGIRVARTGAYGGVTTAYVRGGESNYNKVLLDGIPLNEPGGTFNFNNLTSINLERIEIVRGAQSALFGSDAMSSVIQMVTRRARPGAPLQGSFAAEGGSFATGRIQGGISGGAGRTDYSLGLAHLSTDNEVPNNAFRNSTVSASAGTELGPSATLRGVLRAEIGKAGAPGQTAFGRADGDAFFNRRDVVAGVTLKHDLTANLRQQMTYALAATRQRSANLELDPPYTPEFEGRRAPFEFFDFLYDSRTSLHRHYASYQADWHPAIGSSAAGTQQTTFAADWDGERGDLRDELAHETTTVSRNNVGITVQQQALWRRVFATGGVRFEHNASFGNAAVPRASIAMTAHRSRGAFGETTLKASAGKGIKEPTVLQSYSRNSFFLGNPDLRPERSRTVDAGIEQRLGHDRAKVELTWYDNRYHDIISTRTISFNPFQSQYFNLGETRARGLELSGEVAPVAGFHLRGGYTLTASEVIDSAAPADTVFGVGHWLFRRPRHSGFFEASWTDARASLDLIASIVGRRVDSDFSSLEPAIIVNRGHTTWDVRAGYRLSRSVALTLAIDNLTDRAYMEPLGYPALGRAIRAGVRTGF
jgi:vitamin B12 transporter